MFDVAPANGKLIVSGPLAKSQSGAVRSNDVTSVPFGITAVMSAAPVSYTHLDVYKRQLLWSLNKYFLILIYDILPTIRILDSSFCS